MKIKRRMSFTKSVPMLDIRGLDPETAGRALPEVPPAAAQRVAQDGSARRVWRISRDDLGSWRLERVTLDLAGHEVRDLSEIYRDRAQAERAIIRAMRQDPLWRPAGS